MADKIKLSSVCPKVFGISPRRYRQLSKKGLVPEPDDGRVDFLVATKRLLVYYRKLASGQGSLSLTEERARLVSVQAELAELELQKTLREVVSSDEVVEMWTAMILAARSRLLSLPIKLASILEWKKKTEIKDSLEKYIYEALDELAGFRKKNIQKYVAEQKEKVKKVVKKVKKAIKGKPPKKKKMKEKKVKKKNDITKRVAGKRKGVKKLESTTKVDRKPVGRQKQSAKSGKQFRARKVANRKG